MYLSISDNKKKLARFLSINIPKRINENKWKEAEKANEFNYKRIKK